MDSMRLESKQNKTAQQSSGKVKGQPIHPGPEVPFISHTAFSPRPTASSDTLNPSWSRPLTLPKKRLSAACSRGLCFGSQNTSLQRPFDSPAMKRSLREGGSLCGRRRPATIYSMSPIPVSRLSHRHWEAMQGWTYPKE